MPRPPKLESWLQDPVRPGVVSFVTAMDGFPNLGTGIGLRPPQPSNYRIRAEPSEECPASAAANSAQPRGFLFWN